MTWTASASGHTPAAEGETSWEPQERELAEAIARVLVEKGGNTPRLSFHGNFVELDNVPAADVARYLAEH